MGKVSDQQSGNLRKPGRNGPEGAEGLTPAVCARGTRLIQQTESAKLPVTASPASQIYFTPILLK